MTPEIKEIKTAYKGLQTLYDIYLPNVDPTLIDDLLMRQQQKENSNAIPFYMVEAFTMPEIDSEAERNLIFDTLFEIYLPRADPVHIHDLLVREQLDPTVAPFYMVEVQE